MSYSPWGCEEPGTNELSQHPVKNNKDKDVFQRRHISREMLSTYVLGFLVAQTPGKESAGNAGDLGLIPGLGRSPGEGNGNLLQYSCLENSMNRGAWWATVHGVKKATNTLYTYKCRGIKVYKL